MYKLNRRQLLLGSLMAAGLGGVDRLLPFAPFSRANAATDKEMHYIFCYFSGAWDILLSLDPRDPATFTNANTAKTLIQPGYEYLDSPPNNGMPIDVGNGMILGPYMGDLANHASKLAVIRGMSMETLTHEVGKRRFLTGRVPSGLQARGSSAATWLASLLGQDNLLPNLSIKVETYNVDQPNFASALRVSNQPDLLRVLMPGEVQLQDKVEAQIDYLLSEASKSDAALASQVMQVAESSRLQSDFVLSSGLGGIFDFGAKTDQMAAIRDHYGFSSSSNGLSTAEARAAMAATAIKEGISRCVSFEIAGGLDSHGDEWTTDQGPNQMAGFNSVARMIEDLQNTQYKDTGDTWLDHTVILGFSEFSRTAMLNANTGRDHSLTNACFMLGGGLKGGSVVGRSSDVGMSPTETNLTTGEPDLDGEVVRPEHIMRTLMAHGGIAEDLADLRVEPLSCLLS